MAASLLKRLAWTIPTLLAVSAIVFYAARLAPSDPVTARLGEKATEEQKAQMRHKYGFDRPLPVQYCEYVWNICAHGDFGQSFTEQGLPVSRMIREDFPVTAQLALTALAIALAIGLPVGVLAAYYHNSLFDRALMTVVVALVSVPSIVLAPVLVLLFAVSLRWLPVSGWDSPANVILPSLALAARSGAIFARFMRSSLLDVLRQDYIRAAMAKGYSRPKAVWRHGIKNALLPVITVVGTSFGALLTGSFVVETIFQVPGIGFASIASIGERDYPVIQGMALLVAAIYLFVNIAVDTLYSIIDPRIRAVQ